MIDWNFNKHRFFTQGFNVGFLPADIHQQCKDIIDTTTWVGDKPTFAEWAVIPSGEHTHDESFYEELVRGKLSYGNAPTSVKNLSNAVIDMPFFDPLREILVKKQHQQYRGVRNIKPNGMGLWDKQLDVSWHNDISDTSDFFVLIYVNDYESWNLSWGGQLLLGREREDDSIECLYAHDPIDATFVVLNNMNPLFKHAVVSAGDRTRTTIGLRYKIE